MSGPAIKHLLPVTGVFCIPCSLASREKKKKKKLLHLFVGCYLRKFDKPLNVIYRVFIKNCVLSKFTATHPLHVGEQPICARDLSVQSLLLAGRFCTTNSSPVMARERSRNIKFLEKNYV